MKSGSLNLLGPSVLVQACNGIILPTYIRNYWKLLALKVGKFHPFYRPLRLLGGVEV
jgi:hypothetical protein